MTAPRDLRVTDHGCTDSGPPPRHDFSSNANCLGPDPWALAAIRDADARRYPDPAYAALRERIGASRGLPAERIVPGAGTSELLLRVAHAIEGPVFVLEPCFGEYYRVARIAGRPLVAASSEDALLDRLGESPRAPHRGWCVLAQPVNPTGRILSEAFLRAVADACLRRGSPLLLDLAYADLADTTPFVPAGAWRLVSPNKRHALTGVRAAWLEAPDALTGEDLGERAPAWCVSAHGQAFLEAVVSEPSRAWLASTLAPLRGLRDGLREVLARHGLVADATQANFMTVPVPHGLIEGLRREGIRVRDCASQGLPGRARLSAQREEALVALDEALARLISPEGESVPPRIAGVAGRSARAGEVDRDPSRDADGAAPAASRSHTVPRRVGGTRGGPS